MNDDYNWKEAGMLASMSCNTVHDSPPAKANALARLTQERVTNDGNPTLQLSEITKVCK
jgi:hypothetical protein